MTWLPVYAHRIRSTYHKDRQTESGVLRRTFRGSHSSSVQPKNSNELSCRIGFFFFFFYPQRLTSEFQTILRLTVCVQMLVLDPVPDHSNVFCLPRTSAGLELHVNLQRIMCEMDWSTDETTEAQPSLVVLSQQTDGRQGVLCKHDLSYCREIYNKYREKYARRKKRLRIWHHRLGSRCTQLYTCIQSSATTCRDSQFFCNLHSNRKKKSRKKNCAKVAFCVCVWKESTGCLCSFTNNTFAWPCLFRTLWGSSLYEAFEKRIIHMT